MLNLWTQNCYRQAVNTTKSSWKIHIILSLILIHLLTAYHTFILGKKYIRVNFNCFFINECQIKEVETSCIFLSI